MKQTIFITLVVLVGVCGGLQCHQLEKDEIFFPPEEVVFDVSDSTEMEAFIDGIMSVQMTKNHIAGAAFVVIKGGEIFFAKGYGYSDIEEKIPVAADKTLFRVASISKLMTWTSVMQLVEQGKIDLDADINIYLNKFKIPETFPEPITMTHLLTHTAGFEEAFTGVFTRRAGGLVPLGDFLEKNIPERLLPPGSLASYSNYGTALAGYIVEVVTGTPFEKYVEENIFEPLGMESSTFRQPLPEALAGNMSKGYSYTKGVFVPAKFELVRGLVPAGAMTTTAVDMAKFIIAHLRKGILGENRILNQETFERMHTRLFSHHPQIEGNAYGFWERKYNELSLIGHEGDTLFFHSLLLFVPEENFGFFVSYNSTEGGGYVRDQLAEAILDRYFPPSEPVAWEATSDFKKRAGRFTGTYGITKFNSSRIAKIMSLPFGIKVSATRQDTLLISSPLGTGPRQWVEISPLVFKEKGGQNTVAFREDEKGHITHLFFGQIPMFAYIKLHWYENPRLHLMILIVLLLFFASTFSWPLGALYRKICKRGEQERVAPVSARLLVGAMSFLCVVFIGGIAFFLTRQAGFAFGIPLAIKILLVLPFIGILFAVWSLYFALIVWIKRSWSVCARVHYLLVLGAFGIFLWFLSFWNLLGFKL